MKHMKKILVLAMVAVSILAVALPAAASLPAGTKYCQGAKTIVSYHAPFTGVSCKITVVQGTHGWWGTNNTGTHNHVIYHSAASCPSPKCTYFGCSLPTR